MSATLLPMSSPGLSVAPAVRVTGEIAILSLLFVPVSFFVPVMFFRSMLFVATTFSGLIVMFVVSLNCPPSTLTPSWSLSALGNCCARVFRLATFSTVVSVPALPGGRRLPMC